MTIDANRFAQWLGLFCAIVAAGVLLMFGTYLSFTSKVDPETVWIFAGLSLIAVMAGWASATRRPVWLLVAWFVSFVPVGLYLLLLPSWVRIAGLAQLGFGVAAVMMLRNRRQAHKP